MTHPIDPLHLAETIIESQSTEIATMEKLLG